jgi:hypothetical protein
MVLGGVLAACWPRPSRRWWWLRRLPGRLLVAVVGAVVSLLALRNLQATLQAGGGA